MTHVMAVMNGNESGNVGGIW